MNKLKQAVSAIVAAVKAYPNGVAIVINVAVVLAARFGFNLTATELVAVAVAVHAALSAFTHKTTVPTSLLKGK